MPNLARPGGNITGLSAIAPDLEGKRLELLREVVPHLAHVAFFLNPANEFHTVSMRQALAAAEALNIKLIASLAMCLHWLNDIVTHRATHSAR